MKIAITTGDHDGIGLEVAVKALVAIGPQKSIQFILWRSSKASNRALYPLKKVFNPIKVSNLQEALLVSNSSLVEINSEESPAKWVEDSAKACLNQELQALCTGPLSKTTILEAGFKDLGHTDILKRISRTKKVHMAFMGNKFSVVLATGHLPLSHISKHLSFSTLTEAILHANSLRLQLPKTHQKKPLAILGLNPHAGEKGLIGKEELLLFPELQSWALENKIVLDGPLVPDAAFFPRNWKKYSVYVALYHDQGLIPFKMVHGQDSGVHITMGIPFIRTSVDHGTAKDIFNKNRANPASMIDAIRCAVKFARLRG